MEGTAAEDGAARPVRTAEGEAKTAAEAAATAGAEGEDDRGEELMVKAGGGACRKWQKFVL